MATYFEGLLLGLAFIAPLGIANLFIINTALNQPRHTAYLTATVVAVFDVFLSIVCFYGVGQLLMQYQLLKVGILLVGGILVALIGINIMRTEAQPPSATEQNFSWVKVFSMALMVTWLNPQALIDGSRFSGIIIARSSAAIHYWHCDSCLCLVPWLNRCVKPL